jgi:hypothetical protein
MDKQFVDAAFAFLDSFEVVFGHDWEHTKNSLHIANTGSQDGTLIDPGVEDEGDNWGNRGGLLASYRKFRERAPQAGYIPLEERDIS